MNDSETYTMEAHCRNCGETWKIYIPKGTSVIVYEKSVICDNCKCGDIIIQKERRFG